MIGIVSNILSDKVSGVDNDISSSENVFNNKVDNMLVAAADKLGHKEEDYKKTIETITHTNSMVDNPEMLFKLQVAVNSFSILENTASSLAHKGITAIETLVKS